MQVCAPVGSSRHGHEALLQVHQRPEIKMNVLVG